MITTRTLILAASVALLAGCDERPVDDVSTPSPTTTPSVAPVSSYEWDSTVVDEAGGGLQTHMIIGGDGNPAVAYFAPMWPEFNIPLPDDLPGGDRTGQRSGATSGQDGARGDGGSAGEDAVDVDTPDFTLPPFSPPPIDLPEMDPFYELRFARWTGYVWEIERVARTNHARGLSLLETRDGITLISYLDTDQASNSEICTDNRLAVAVRTTGGWKKNVVVNAELEGEPICDDENNCLCEVVGEWSSLAEGEGDTVGLTYRRSRYNTADIGGLDSDQEFVELALSGTELSAGLPEKVHPGEGVGIYGSIEYGRDAANRLVPSIAYLSLSGREEAPSSSLGLWYARYDASLGDWVRHEVMPGRDWVAGPQVQLAIDDATTYILLYAWKGTGSSAVLDLVLLRSPDRGETWEDEFITTEGRAGSFPSLAFTGDDQLAVSYYRCGNETDRLCAAENDGLMLAVRQETGEWRQTLVHESYEETDGTYTALGFYGDYPIVAARSVTGIGPEAEQRLDVFFGTPVEP